MKRSERKSKNRRNIVIAVIAVIVILLLLLVSCQKRKSGQDTGIAGHWAEQAIETWSGRGVLTEREDGFAPDEPITRAELCRSLYQLLDLEAPADTALFDDVKAEDAAAVAACSEAGLIDAYSGGFSPDSPVTRAELEEILSRVFGSGALQKDGVRALLSDADKVEADGVSRALVAALLDEIVTAYLEPGVSGDLSAQDTTGVVLVTADNTALTNAEPGTVVVVPNSVTGTTVNGAAVPEIVNGAVVNGETVPAGTVYTVPAAGTAPEATATPAPTAAPTEKPAATKAPASVKATATPAPAAPAPTATPAASGGSSDSSGAAATPTPTPLPALTVETILPVNALPLGEKQLLTAQTNPADGVTLTASSDAQTVAKVTVDGSTLTVEPVAAGTATITVTGSADGYSNGSTTFTVTVVEATTQIQAAANGDEIASIDNEAKSITVAPYIYSEFIEGQITSLYGNDQTYEVLRSGTAVGNLDYVLAGDTLRVSDTAGNTADYTVSTNSLLLEDPVVTAGAAGDIVLRYHVDLPVEDRDELYGTFALTLPSGITATAEDTINVVGRGEIALSSAAMQAHADYKYSGLNYTDAVLTLSGDGSQILYSLADFRPDNGVDVLVTLKNKTMPSADAVFSAAFTVCDVNGTATGTVYNSSATLTVVESASALERTVSDANYTDLTATSFSALGTPTYVNVYKNGTWERVGLSGSLTGGESVSFSSGSLSLSGLTADTTYRVLVGGEEGDSNIAAVYTGKFDPAAYGAKADGSSDDAAAINAAIAAASRQNGGIVELGNAKTYAATSLHMRSNVQLKLSEGVTLLTLAGCDPAETVNPPFSTAQDPAYNTVQNTFIWGSRLENVSIIGENATINGNGNLKDGSEKKPEKMFSFKLCKNVQITGVSAEKPLITKRWGHYMTLFTGCDQVKVQYILANNTSSSNQRDGVNIIGSHDVKVLNCELLYLYDDVVKLGSTLALGFPRGCEDIYVDGVHSVTAGGSGNLFQLGSETIGDFKNLTIKNMTLDRSADKAGISIAVNDGGDVSNVLIENVTLKGARGGIFLSVCDRNTKSVGGITAKLPDLMRRPGSISGVTIKNVTIESQKISATNSFPIMISGYEGHYTVGSIVTGQTYKVKNVTLDNVKFVATATGNATDVSTVLTSPTNGCYNPNSYPNVKVLPAYGALLTNVDNVTIKNSDLSYSSSVNYRYAMVLNNATNVTVENTSMEMSEAVGAIQIRGASDYKLTNVVLKYSDGTAHSASPLTREGSLKASDAWIHLPETPENADLKIVSGASKVTAVDLKNDVITTSKYTTYGDLLKELVVANGGTIELLDASGKAVNILYSVTKDAEAGLTNNSSMVPHYSALVGEGYTLKATSAAGNVVVNYTFSFTDKLYDVLFEAEELSYTLSSGGIRYTAEGKDSTTTNASASGWAIVNFRDPVVGDTVTYTFSGLPAGTYKMVYGTKGHATNKRAIVEIAANSTVLGTVDVSSAGEGFHDYSLEPTFTVGADGTATVVISVTGNAGAQLPIDTIRLTQISAPVPSVDLSVASGASKVTGIDLKNDVITTSKYTTYGDLLKEITVPDGASIELQDASGKAVTILYSVTKDAEAGLTNNSSMVPHYSALVGEGYTLKATSGDVTTSYTFSFTDKLYDVLFEAEELSYTLSSGGIRYTAEGKHSTTTNASASGWAIVNFRDPVVGDTVTYTFSGLPAGTYKMVYGTKGHATNKRAIVEIAANSTVLGTVDVSSAGAGFHDYSLEPIFTVEADGKATVVISVTGNAGAQLPIDTIHLIAQ